MPINYWRLLEKFCLFGGSAKFFHIVRHDVGCLDIDYIYINIYLSHSETIETCSSSYATINYFAWQSCRALWNGVQLVSSQFFCMPIASMFQHAQIRTHTETHTDTDSTHTAYNVLIRTSADSSGEYQRY